MLRQPGFKVGRDGLERTYEKELRGVAGTMDVKVNAHGRVIEEVEDSVKPPVQGETLGLTIDAELQMAAMKALEGESASAVVIDVETGDILVLASTPAFDPNIFTKGIPSDLWRELNESPYKPLLNKPLGGIYPPGSTFKMVTAIAAMRSGISPSFAVRCNGKFWYGNRFFHCWRKEGHGGGIDMKNAIKHSCDTSFTRSPPRLDVDIIADAARKLGLDQTFELGVPGQHSGVVPDRAWKKRLLRRHAGKPDVVSRRNALGRDRAGLCQRDAAAAGRHGGAPWIRPRSPAAAGPRFAVRSNCRRRPFVESSIFRTSISRSCATAWTPSSMSRAAPPGRSAFDNKEWQLAGKTGTSQVYRDHQ